MRTRTPSFVSHSASTSPVGPAPAIRTNGGVCVIVGAVSAPSESGEPLDGVGEALDQVDQKRGLRIRPRAPLLPVLQRAHIGSKIRGKDPARDLEVFAHAHEFF